MIWNDPPIMSMTAANIVKPTAQLLLCCSMFPPWLPHPRCLSSWSPSMEA